MSLIRERQTSILPVINPILTAHAQPKKQKPRDCAQGFLQ